MEQNKTDLQVLMFGCLPYFLGWLLTALSTSVSYLYSARNF
jgi:hypothetical protein